MREADVLEKWNELFELFSHLIGETDAMNFGQLNDLLVNRWNYKNANTIQEINTLQKITNIQQSIVASRMGKPEISSDCEFKNQPLSSDPVVYEFRFLGACLTIDTWVTEKVVGDMSFEEKKNTHDAPCRQWISVMLYLITLFLEVLSLLEF